MRFRENEKLEYRLIKDPREVCSGFKSARQPVKSSSLEYGLEQKKNLPYKLRPRNMRISEKELANLGSVKLRDGEGVSNSDNKSGMHSTRRASIRVSSQTLNLPSTI